MKGRRSCESFAASLLFFKKTALIVDRSSNLELVLVCIVVHVVLNVSMCPITILQNFEAAMGEH